MTTCAHVPIITSSPPELLVTASKLLHLPQEAALLLRGHEVGLVAGWAAWLRGLTLDLSGGQAAERGGGQGPASTASSADFLARVHHYNLQVT